ncbi:hypothetical protein BB560_000010 [Smittium megazygosporum]|uniref:Uncharacterized protein n=1 Tax=Smittium megazygosporum TaxID=133381 RepID=A0A2T9ZLM6_9FUNG|nr:hypothetical protein BB560_000010 [Smittium megazygosporum]
MEIQLKDLLSKLTSRSLKHKVSILCIVLLISTSALLYTTGIVFSCAFGSAMVILLTTLSRKLIGVVYEEPINWSNQVVVISGGSNGIGRCAVESFMQYGAKVAILDINEPKYDINEKTCKYYECDIGDNAQITRTVNDIVETLGKPTVLLNNAAIVLIKSILDSSVEDFDRVSYLGSVYLTRAILPYMIENNSGHIITIASMLAFSGIPNCVSYCASKAAINIFFEGLRFELAQTKGGENIHVTTIFPAKVTTNMFSGVEVPQTLIPNTTPEQVAERALKSVLEQEGSDIFMPITGRLSIPLMCFPRFVRDWCHSILDVASSTKHFDGNKW